VPGDRNPNSRVQAIQGETSEASGRREEKERACSGRAGSEGNKQAVLLGVAAHCTQNATFPEFGVGVTDKLTGTKGCGLSARTGNVPNPGLNILTPRLARC